MNIKRKKRMTKGRNWLRPPAARPPLTSYAIRKRKGKERARSLWAQSGESYAASLSHSPSSYFSQPSKHKGPQLCPPIPTPFPQSSPKHLLPFKTLVSSQLAAAMPQESQSKKPENKYWMNIIHHLLYSNPCPLVKLCCNCSPFQWLVTFRIRGLVYTKKPNIKLLFTPTGQELLSPLLIYLACLALH